jgi:prevent-host-death family protein
LVKNDVMQINLYEAKTRLSELVEAASKGKAVTIGKAGKPLAKLGPLELPRRRIKLGLMRGGIRIARDFDAPLPEDVLDAFAGKRRP